MHCSPVLLLWSCRCHHEATTVPGNKSIAAAADHMPGRRGRHATATIRISSHQRTGKMNGISHCITPSAIARHLAAAHHQSHRLQRIASGSRSIRVGLGGWR